MNNVSNIENNFHFLRGFYEGGLLYYKGRMVIQLACLKDLFVTVDLAKKYKDCSTEEVFLFRVVVGQWIDIADVSIEDFMYHTVDLTKEKYSELKQTIF